MDDITTEFLTYSIAWMYAYLWRHNVIEVRISE